MKAVIFILGIVVACSAVSIFTQFPMDFSKRRSILAIMTQVEAQLKMGGPLDAITKALDSFAEAIATEQATHDALKQKQDKECEEEFALRERAVKEATEAEKAASETLAGCVNQKLRAEGDLKATQESLRENEQFLINAITARNQEHYDFVTSQGKHDSLLKAIDEALGYIDEFASGGHTSFAQIAKHTNGMLMLAVQLKTVQHMGPALSALAQLATMDEGDEAFVEQLKGIFRKFRDQTVADFQARQTAENEAANKFAEEQTRLQGNIDHLKQQSSDLESEINQLTQCVATQTSIVNDATTKLKRNAQLLDDAKAVCAAFQKEYEDSTQARKEEAALLEAIRVKVEERYAQLQGKDSVTTRGVQEQSDWQHENKSAYQADPFARQGEVVFNQKKN